MRGMDLPNIPLLNALSDPRYPESVAYHEAGHIVVAAIQGMRISRHGVRVDNAGLGISYYETRKPKRISTAPCAVTREQTIIAAKAGLMAQQMFHSDCSIEGAVDDNDRIDELLAEIRTEEEFPPLEIEYTTALIDTHREAQRLVKLHWPAIELLGRSLWSRDETPFAHDQPNPEWTKKEKERLLLGHQIAEVLGGSINVVVWDAQTPVQD
jgi:hypothetical protein